MNSLGANFGIWFPSVLLIAGLMNDLLYRKYHNVHFLIALSVTIVAVFALFGLNGLMTGLTGALVAVAIGTLLTLTGVIGAGDMKLMLVFGFATQYESVIYVFILSLVWGAVLGLAQALFAGELKSIASNLRTMAVFRLAPDKKKLHMIPFTVPLLLGWVTFNTLKVSGFGGIL